MVDGQRCLAPGLHRLEGRRSTQTPRYSNGALIPKGVPSQTGFSSHHRALRVHLEDAILAESVWRKSCRIRAATVRERYPNREAGRLRAPLPHGYRWRIRIELRARLI